MRTLVRIAVLVCCLASVGCARREDAPPPAAVVAAPAAVQKASDVPPLDANNIVSIAVGSKDHSTLVAALKAADYVASVANPGPLTVFAPTNAAFDKLPPGTVESLVQPARLDELRNILKYHVAPATYEVAALKDGMSLGMANGARATIHVKDGKLRINDATVVASVRASNGIVHIVDTVLLPPASP